MLDFGFYFLVVHIAHSRWKGVWFSNESGRLWFGYRKPIVYGLSNDSIWAFKCYRKENIRLEVVYILICKCGRG